MAEPPIAVPPHIAPEDWEDFSVLRETFLLEISDPGANASLRLLAKRFYDMVLLTSDLWPEGEELFTVSEMKAGLADLRVLQGFFAAIGSEREVHTLQPKAIKLSRIAGQQAAALGLIGDEIEKALAGRTSLRQRRLRGKEGTGRPAAGP